MKDFLLENNSNDLVVRNFDFQFTEGSVEYIAQKLRIKLKTFLGEYFLNNSIGVPYFDKVLVKNPDTDLIADLFKTQILEEGLVDELVSFDQDYDSTTRGLTTTFTVRVLEQEVTVSL